MGYAVVAAVLDLDLPTQGVLTASARLADLFGAQTVGVAAAVPPMFPYFADGAVADKLVEAAADEVRAQLKSAEQAFRAANASRVDRVEWRSAEQLPDGFAIASARAVDLIIAARREAVATLRGPDIGNLVMQSGRPVLLVPPEGSHFSTDRILIAWKDTREARRAITDALPILGKAKDVQLLVVHEPEASEAKVLASANDVAGFLAWHGVKATLVVRTDSNSAGRSIEQCADEVGADLIVAGAYGRSRFMETLFGGVTRHLLQSRTTRVLLSH